MPMDSNRKGHLIGRWIPVKCESFHMPPKSAFGQFALDGCLIEWPVTPNRQSNAQNRR